MDERANRLSATALRPVRYDRTLHRELQERRLTAEADLICETCGKAFALTPAIAAKYPGWRPKQCMSCRSGKRAPRSGGGAERLTRAEVLVRHSAGPTTGIFTDGHCEPNPGRGGWGAVKVADDAIVEERSG